MKRSALIICAFSAFIAYNAYASDTFEDYKNAQMGEYQSYLSAMDRDFSDFLKQQWQEYQGQKPEKPYVAPKPVEIPVAKPEPVTKPVEIMPKAEPVVQKPVETVPEPKAPEAKPTQVPVPAAPVVPQPKVPEPKVPVPFVPLTPKPAAPAAPQPPYVPAQDSMVMSFFGLRLDIPYDKKLAADVAQPISSENIADWWEKAASANYAVTMRYMQDIAQRNQLGDWGYIMLLDRFAAKLKGAAPEQKMLVWFFLNKSGYDARLGYTNSGVTKVMMRSDVALYGIPYFTFGSDRYYVVNTLTLKDTTESLYTYNGSYPDAKNQLSLLHMKTPSFSFVRYDRTLKYEFGGKEYSMNAVANKNDIQYYNTFPQADLEVYTSAQVPVWIDKTVVPALTENVKGKSLDESVNMILRFVQTAFNYKTDEQQFGREKFFFAEETIYYPYSDCEDRSILFAYLVETILKRNVIMLNFPNHIATAVDMGNDVKGAYLSYKGKKYTVADPTYINADAGMVMPEFKNVNPEIEETGLTF